MFTFLKMIPWQLIRQIFGVVIGAVIVAASVNTFIIANEIADGGLTGVAIILHYLLSWEVGLTLFILNIPLFILGYKVLGKTLLFLSILGVTTFSMAIDLTHALPPITEDSLLASVFGGLITGIGMGLIFRSRGSLGGTDIISILLSTKTPFSVGQILLAIDAVIFVAAAILFEPEMAMYAMIYMFIVTRVIDLVQTGLNYSKSVLIITTEPYGIADEIISKLERGVTFFEGMGAFSQEEKKIVYSIINRAQLIPLKEIVHKHDPRAFIAINDVSEVIGEGFSHWTGH